MKALDKLNMNEAAGGDKHSHGSSPIAQGAHPRKSKEWSVTRKMRLPHKVGLPLGSGGGGDDAGS